MRGFSHLNQQMQQMHNSKLVFFFCTIIGVRILVRLPSQDKTSDSKFFFSPSLANNPFLFVLHDMRLPISEFDFFFQARRSIFLLPLLARAR